MAVYRPLAALALAVLGTDSRAGDLVLPQGAAGPGPYTLGVASYAERRFQTVLRQQYDFSCGSAALASLLRFHYQDPVGELDVFADMWAHGDQARIQKQGFSMLDMKQYLARRGYRSDGFKTGLAQLAQAQVPAITIINNKGYMHFVIIKGLNTAEALIGDPAQGLKILDLAQFQALWENRILFIIHDRRDIATAHFNTDSEWRLSPKAPLGRAVDQGSLAAFNLLQPGAWDF